MPLQTHDCSVSFSRRLRMLTVLVAHWLATRLVCNCVSDTFFCDTPIANTATRSVPDSPPCRLNSAVASYVLPLTKLSATFCVVPALPHLNITVPWKPDYPLFHCLGTQRALGQVQVRLCVEYGNRRWTLGRGCNTSQQSLQGNPAGNNWNIATISPV